ncbi:MAG TPA: hypothetical protein V6D15_22450 [Oculatellaceae cyanobacterium]
MSKADTSNNYSLPEIDALIDQSDQQSMSAEETDWLTVIKNLRQRNRGLIKQVSELEQALRDYQEAIQSQQARSQAQETLLVQQKEVLDASEQQVSRLFHELESSHKVAQRQQVLIETLSHQLESSQQRLVDLERESTLTHERYQEQSNRLSQAENLCQELHIRLQRQQRQTLQFKLALEKCLEVPAPGYDSQAEPGNFESRERHLKTVLAAQSLIPKVQPIKPWSAQQDAFEENTNINAHNVNLAQQQVNQVTTESEQLININAHSNLAQQQVNQATTESEQLINIKDNFNLAQQQVNPQKKQPENLTDINSISFQLTNSQLTSIIEADSDNFELPNYQIAPPIADLEQLEDSNDEEISSSIVDQEQPELVANSTVVEPEFKQNFLEQMPELESVYALLDALDDDDDDDTLPNPDQNSEVVLNQSNPEPVPMQEVEPAPDVEEMAQELATQKGNAIAQALTCQFADINATEPRLPTEPILPQPKPPSKFATPEPILNQEPILPQPNWPSPVIYPQRPAKKLKSLAAIDLPKFPRHQ